MLMKDQIYLILTMALMLLLSVYALSLGRYSYDFFALLEFLKSYFLGWQYDPRMEIVVFSVRLPRIILALFVGASLAISGAVFQSIFSNPLATPDTLGVASGASFGAVLAILFGAGTIVIQISALIFGLLALFLAYWCSLIRGKSSILMIILSGIVIGAIFTALVALCKYVADEEEVLPNIVFWLLGSLSSANYRTLALILPFMCICSVVLLVLSWRINILSLSEDEARSLGINTKFNRVLIMCMGTMLTASAVAACGQVGWVGLLVPHICRLLFGTNNKRVLPFCIVFGAMFMLLVDTVARTVSNAEIPVSILTALIGAPFFIFLLKKQGRLYAL